MKLIKPIKTFFIRQTLSPFETMFGFFCMYAGVAALFDFGIANTAFRDILGRFATVVFNILYLISGIGMFFGIGLGKGNIEAFGLVLVGTSVIIRTIAISWLVGIQPIIINTYALNAAFVFACVIRLVMIKSQQTLIKKTYGN